MHPLNAYKKAKPLNFVPVNKHNLKVVSTDPVSDTLVAMMETGAQCWRAVVLVASLVVILSNPSLVVSQEQEMRWQQATDPKALCNDYTRAGFFISRNEKSSNWVIFFESGGVCYSRDNCNRHFFSVEVYILIV